MRNNGIDHRRQRRNPYRAPTMDTGTTTQEAPRFVNSRRNSTDAPVTCLLAQRATARSRFTMPDFERIM
jgi:hypothetical protein